MLPETDFFKLGKEELFQLFKTSSSGLTTVEASERLSLYGPNSLTAKEKVSALAIFLNQFRNSLVIILILSALLIFFVYLFGGRNQEDLIEGILIIFIIILISLLGFFQEYKAERSIEALKKLLAFQAKVRRNGREMQIDVRDLVPGDLVFLEEGMKVPADLRLLETNDLVCIEAPLTGESVPVRKVASKLEGVLQIADQKNMAFSGTAVRAGRGLGIVVRTADATEIGKIALEVAEIEQEASPLQKKLDQISKMLGYIILTVSGLIFVFIVFFASETAGLPWATKIIDSFIAAVALAIAAIPEGLPAAVTISLALGTQRMLRRNVLVRKLNSVETLGSTDVICSDKTGTFTKGEMTVREVYYNDISYEVTGVGYESSGHFLKNGSSIESSELNLILEIGQVCNNASIQEGKVSGDPTEAALLVSAEKALVNSPAERIKEIPFTSERKMMSVLVKKEKEFFVFSKGAAESIIPLCDKQLRNGKEVSFSELEKAKVLEQTLNMSEKALRTLAFAFKKTTEKESRLEEDLVFVGLQGMIDPARGEVRSLVEGCRQSGIRIIMITGDHAATAKAVASEVGIEGRALTGAELAQLTDKEFLHIVDEVNIYARINPSSKLQIVDALKRKGHIVAMTGDGVNDAPALKRSDIGIAMGTTGTDVAKEAADLILLDDNFSTIVSAIEEGRGIFDNFRKLINFLLSGGLAELLIVFLAVVLFQHQPLSAIMLLWINVITDGLPALALGLDPTQNGIMRFSPKQFQGDIINKRVWVEMGIFCLLATFGVLGIYLINLQQSAAEARAAAFIAIVFFELIRLFNIRSNYNTPFFSNIWLLVAIVGSLLVQLALVYVPFLAKLFEVQAIGIFDWGYIAIGCLVIWLVFTLLKKPLESLEKTAA